MTNPSTLSRLMPAVLGRPIRRAHLGSVVPVAAPERMKRPDELELSVLLKAVAGGDREAFARLYDHVAPLVFGVVRRVVRDRAMSEEVAQEVLLEIWKTSPRYNQGQGSVASWILTIARRRAVDRVRSEQSSRDRMARIGPANIEREHDEVADQALRAERIGAVGSALSMLSSLQKEALELAYFEGLTTTQIAERLGLPLGTVKSRIRDGMIRLRQSLEEAG
ncbi:MAG: ECF RNA polymerase sigma factor SigK [Actinomycetota bacterium]